MKLTCPLRKLLVYKHQSIASLKLILCCGLFTFSVFGIAQQQDGDYRPKAHSPDRFIQTSNDQTKKLRHQTFDFKEDTATEILMPPLKRDSAYLNKVNRRSGPLRVGIHRDIPPIYKGNLADTIQWQEINGGYTGSITVHSPNAKGLRASIVADLPEGSELQIFSLNESSLGASPIDISEETFRNESQFWLPSIEGDRLGIRIFVPNRSNVSIRLRQISHHYRSDFQSGDFELDGCSNHANAACAIEEDENLDADSQISARINFEGDGGSYLCTASLMNDKTKGSFIPFLLTAEHCVGDQESADTLQVRWLYRTTECGTKRLDPEMRVGSGGAYFLASVPNQDISLLKLKDQRDGGNWFAGWDFDTSSITDGSEVHLFHHPLGQEQKFAKGSIEATNIELTACGEREKNCMLVRNAIEVVWDEGASESGSSGAGLVSDGRIVGVLSTGGESCTEAESHFSTLHETGRTISNFLAADDNDDHGDNRDTATLIYKDDRTRGFIETTDDADYFKVEFDHAGRFTAYTESDMDTVGTLLRNTSEYSNDDGGEDKNFRIERNVSAGTYYLKVENYHTSTDTGQFDLFTSYTLADVADESEDAYRIFDLPAVRFSAIDEESDVDWYVTQVLDKGTLHVVTFGFTDVKCAILPTINSSLKAVYDDDSGIDQNCQAEMTVTPGFYYIRIDGHDESITGDYNLLLAFEHEDDHGNDMENPTLVGSTADNWSLQTHAHLGNKDVDVFKVNLDYMGVLVITSLSSLDLVGTLYDSEGIEVAFNDDSGLNKDFNMIEAVEAGGYFIEVRGYFDDEEGDYGLGMSFTETF